MTTQKLYQKTLNEEMTPKEFLWHVRRNPQYSELITNTMSYEDTVSVLKAKGHIWESKEKENAVKSFDFIGTFKSLNEGYKKQKIKGGKGDKLIPDQVNYYEFTKGWKCELEHTDDIDKAKEIALDHLAEDPIYYTRLEMMETQAKKKNRTDLPIDISKKKAYMKDEANQMISAEKKKETSNVSDSGNQEKAKSKSAGIQKQKGYSGEMKSINEAKKSTPKKKKTDKVDKGTKSYEKGELEYDKEDSAYKVIDGKVVAAKGAKGAKGISQEDKKKLKEKGKYLYDKNESSYDLQFISGNEIKEKKVKINTEEEFNKLKNSNSVINIIPSSKNKKGFSDTDAPSPSVEEPNKDAPKKTSELEDIDDDTKASFKAVFTTPDPESGKSIDLELTYDRYRRMYISNVKTKKYSKITPKDSNAKLFQKKIKQEIKDEENPVDLEGRGSFKIVDSEGNEKKVDITYDHYVALLNIRKKRETGKKTYTVIKPLDQKARAFVKETPVEDIKIKKEVEPEKTTQTREKTISSDDYPYYVYNRLTKELRGYERREEAIQQLSPSGEENRLLNKLPEKYADPSKNYYVLNPKKVEKEEGMYTKSKTKRLPTDIIEGNILYYPIEGSYNTEEEAKKEAEKLNKQKGTDTYIAVSKEQAIEEGYYNSRIFLIVCEYLSRIIGMNYKDYNKQLKEIKNYPKDWLKKQGPLGNKIANIIDKPREAYKELLKEKTEKVYKIVSNEDAKDLVKSGEASYEREPEKKKKESFAVINIKTGQRINVYSNKADAEKEASNMNKKENVDSYKVISSKKNKLSVSEKYEVLENYIRQKVKVYLQEYVVGPFIGFSGPNVVKDKLQDYLKKYSPDWETDPSPEQKATNSEYENIILKLVSELDDQTDGMGTKIYKEYIGKNPDISQADKADVLPSVISYDPTKLVSRGGRIAEKKAISEEADPEKEKQFLKDAEKTTDADTLKIIQKELQDYITSLGKDKIGKDAVKANMTISNKLNPSSVGHSSVQWDKMPPNPEDMSLRKM